MKQEYLYNDLRQLRKAVRDKADANENKQWSADLGELELLLDKVQRRDTAAAYGETFKTILEALALPVKAGENYKNGRADLLEVKNIVETVRQLSEVLDTLSEDYQNGGLESVPLKAEEYSQLLISACSERQIVLVWN